MFHLNVDASGGKSNYPTIVTQIHEHGGGDVTGRDYIYRTFPIADDPIDRPGLMLYMAMKKSDDNMFIPVEIDMELAPIKLLAKEKDYYVRMIALKYNHSFYCYDILVESESFTFK